MKRRGILHRGLLDLVCSLGHGDIVAVTDRGFPLPSRPGIKIVDLGISEGIPSFEDMIQILLEEIVVEKVYFTQESSQSNPEMIKMVRSLLLAEVETQTIPHAMYKQTIVSQSYENNIGRVVGFIRTGEFTRYTNLFLQCGVAF